MSDVNINMNKMVADVYLSIAQETTQGLSAGQLLDIDCSQETSLCNECIEVMKSIVPEYTSDMCPTCTCKIEDINMTNTISVNFSAFKKPENRAKFVTNLKTSVSQETKLAGTQLFPSDDDENTKNFTNIANNLWEKMSSDQFSKSLQVLQSTQVLTVKRQSPGVSHVNLTAASTILSDIIQSNAVVSGVAKKLNTQVSQIIIALFKFSLFTVIDWVMKIVIILIMVILFLFMINFIFMTLQLYASVKS